MRFENFLAVDIETVLSWVVTLFSLVDLYQHLIKSCCPHLLDLAVS